MKNRNLIYKYLLIIIIFSLMNCTGSPIATAVWERTVKEENAQCPQQIDEITILDSCKYVRPGTVVHYYTLLEEYEPKGIPLYQEHLKHIVTNRLRTDKDFEGLRRSGLKVTYYYRDINKKPIMAFTVTANEYKDVPRLHEDGYVYAELIPIVEAYQKQLPLELDDSTTTTKIELSWPSTIIETTVCSNIILSASFDSIQFKDDWEYGLIDYARNNIYSSLFPGSKIAYKHIYLDVNDKYLCTINIAPADYLRRTERSFNE